MIGIKKIVPFITGIRVPVDYLIKEHISDQSELEYFSNSGINSIFIAEKFSAYDLAKSASLRLLEESNMDGSMLDMIILIKNRLPDTFISSETTRLQCDLGAKKAIAFSLSDLGCTDMSMAIKLGYDYLLSNSQANNVLIAHGCKSIPQSRFRYPVTVCGDGGIAILLSRTNENIIIDFSLEIEGKYWDLFKLSYKDKLSKEYKEECSDIGKYGFELALESKMRFWDMNTSLLQSNNFKKNDISHYILQNISSRAFEFYEEAFDIVISPVCKYNLSQYGHLGPNDVFLNYYTGITNGNFEKGSKVLIMNNSPVAAWSSIIIQI